MLRHEKKFLSNIQPSFTQIANTYTDVHRFASQFGLRSIGVLGSVTKCATQHAGHLNIRLLSIMLYSKYKIITYKYVTID